MTDVKTTTPYAAFLLRVSMGVMFLAHGLLLKIGTFGLAGTMGYFGSIGYPPVFGAIVALAETGAGIALIAGVGVRVVSLLALPIMIGATIQHIPAGWMFSRHILQADQGCDFDFLETGFGAPVLEPDIF